ncbi:uncharacterized protein LOC129883508 [Solanum dulcamara]|uniref:uncharacterized protein LOC129883508 n=1 Tax=Solanum dulcamara TaxID=45834 RepID=UPI002485F28E|nr:uncharacterized protein LOC129883508 [Solanum dulcamara]
MSFPMGWFDAFKVRPWGTDLLRESMERVRMIQKRIHTSQSRQKSYADWRVRPLEFMRYISDESYVIQWDSVQFDESLAFEEEPIAILDRHVRKLRSKEIPSVKVKWRHRLIEKATWETEEDMWPRYPHIFRGRESF